MNKSSIFRSILVVATLFLFASCDKDFNEIGSDVIGDDHFDFLPDDLSTVVAYNHQGEGVVQTNNMLINSLGIYDNPVFGKTKANFVTELQMSTANPTFDQEKFIKLDSVVLTVPYFSTKISTGTDGKGEYELDSIFGGGKIDLKVFESGVILNDLAPPNFQDSQKYYSNEDGRFNNYKIGSHLNNGIPVENVEFLPSAKEIKTYKRDKGLRMDKKDSNIEARLTPRIRLHLNTQFFEDKIINAPAGKLVNNSVFKEYFRGLYFQVQDAGASGTMVQLKFGDGDITLHYREYSELKTDPNNENGPKIPTKFPDTDPLYPGEDIMLAKTFVLKMAGNTVNLLNNTPTGDYSAALQNPNTTIGDERLYVKGGEGSMAVIDLFGADNFGADGLTGAPNGVADELDIIRNNGWLINEANLTFYVDNEKMGANVVGINPAQQVEEPQRVYLFDLTNKRPLIDYYNDGTTISGTPKFNKYVHDGFIQREKVPGGRGVKYRVRITNHIRNLVRVKDSTNVRLGLVVTEYIENVQNAWFKPDPQQPNRPIDRIPQASVMNPLGTVLYGTGANVLPEKKVKLEIYYTKPN